MQLNQQTGLIDKADWVPSPNFDDRDNHCEPEVLIIHCISLPPGQYGGGEIRRFFQNSLSANEHSYFRGMAHLTVSSHFLIDREGALTQFVSTLNRAWHAGESVCLERTKVNNFSIGIELEGWDEDVGGFTAQQYQTLAKLSRCLIQAYPKITDRSIFAHSDIAPGRKPDPGPYFDWRRYLSLIGKVPT